MPSGRGCEREPTLSTTRGGVRKDPSLLGSFPRKNFAQRTDHQRPCTRGVSHREHHFSKAAHGHQDLPLVARGEGTLPETLAVVLRERVTQVTVRHSFRSYAEIAETEAYRRALSALVPAALTRFDVPDCWHELQVNPPPITRARRARGRAILVNKQLGSCTRHHVLTGRRV